MKPNQDWRIFFDMQQNFAGTDEAGNPIQIFPDNRALWPLAEWPLPEYMMTEEELNAEISKFLHTYIYFVSESQYDTVVSWAKATWLVEMWNSVPYLNFSGAPSSGKTKTQDALAEITYHPLRTSNLSVPAMFRALSKWSPTLFIDEFEHQNRDMRNEITGILNSGYRRGSYVLRCEEEGGKQVILPFNVFGFKCMAGINVLPPATMTRCIRYVMFKTVRDLNLIIDKKWATAIRTQLLIWRMVKLWKFLSNELGEGSNYNFRELVSIDRLDTFDSVSGVDTTIKRLSDKFKDGRFVEKYYPLLITTPDLEIKVLEFAQKEFDNESESLSTSPEAEVVLALMSFRERLTKEVAGLKGKRLATKEVADKLNEGITNPSDKWKVYDVGRVIQRIGFEDARTAKGGRGFKWDDERLDYNIKRYHLEEISPPEVVSNPSNVSKNVLFDSLDSSGICEMCGERADSLYKVEVGGNPLMACSQCKSEIGDG